MRRLVLLGLLALIAGCGSCTDEGDGEPAGPEIEETPEPEETEQPDAAPIELPVARSATEPPDPSPALGVHTNAVTLDGDMFRTPLVDGQLPDSLLEEGRIEGLQTILANLRFRAGGAPGQFRSSLTLRADRRARWDTVRTVTATAAHEGFLNMKVLVRTDDDVPRWFRVRAERDDTEPHLRAHLDADGVDIRAPGLARALEEACGAAPEGPLRVAEPGVDWTWETLDPCQRTALTEITAETPSAGVTAAADVTWDRVVHVFDLLRALREDPDRLALLLE